MPCFCCRSGPASAPRMFGIVGMMGRKIDRAFPQKAFEMNYKFTRMGLIPITIIGYIVVFGRLVLADWLVMQDDWYTNMVWL